MASGANVPSVASQLILSLLLFLTSPSSLIFPSLHAYRAMRTIPRSIINLPSARQRLASSYCGACGVRISGTVPPATPPAYLQMN